MQKNHQRLAELKARLFLDFVRTKYHLPTQRITEEFFKPKKMKNVDLFTITDLYHTLTLKN